MIAINCVFVLAERAFFTTLAAAIIQTLNRGATKMPIITVRKCPKVYILETHRSRTPETTLRFVEEMKDVLGMLAFQDATDTDRLNIPVFLCNRTRPDQSSTSHTGKGVSPIQAQVSLTMESIERYSSEYRDEYAGKLIKGSYNQLRRKFDILDPRSLILSSMNDYSHDREIFWTWGTDLVSEADILVPACAVYHPFHLDDTFLITTHTNGIAAGNTMEEAIVHGTAEIIERDAWSIAQYNRTFADALFVEDTAANGFIVDVIAKYEQAEIEIVAKDITSDVGVPVVAAFSRDLHHEAMVPIDGFGAHLDPKVAAVRALLEIATTRALFFRKYGLERMQDSLPPYYWEEEDDPRFCALQQKSLGAIPAEFTDDIAADIRLMTAKLCSRGLDKVIAVDLTRPDIGVPTVRMIVPGMEATCFDRSRKGERLLNVSAEGL